jgi:hypothetical protein
VDPKSLLLVISLLIVMIAVPSLESRHKSDILNSFGTIVNEMIPATELGLYSIILYATIVAVWDGVCVLPARYIELFVAMSFTSVQQFVLIMILGKTLGGFVTHKIANSFLRKDRVLMIMFTNSSSFVFEAIQKLICSNPYIYGLMIRMFFPSVLINFYLALTPLPRTKFVFIQFLYAVIISYPQALFDYYGFLDKKFKLIDGKVRIIYQNHADLINYALDHKMDIFRLTFMVCQFLGMVFLAIRILMYNRKISN